MSRDPRVTDDDSENGQREARGGPSAAGTSTEPTAMAGDRLRKASDDVLGGPHAALKDRLAELERRSLLAEQARQLAHRMRTPLNVIELICESLQIELQQDEEQVARLESALDAVSRLATILSETVKSNRFVPGPQRALDAAGIAARLVRVHQGTVGCFDAAQPRPLVVLEPRAFEAAIMHCLRLIGLSPGRGACNLSLSCDLSDDRLSLSLRAQGDGDLDSACLGADPTLVLQAAERIVRDIGGTLSLAEGTATLRLPIAEP